MRETIIVDFFLSLQKQCQYAILHHVRDIFEKTTDIDFVVDCDKIEMQKFITDFCKENKLYYLKNTIDLGADRYNLVGFGNTEIIKIELDVTFSSKNILGINFKKALSNVKPSFVKNRTFNVLDSRDEFDVYLKKKAFKKDITEKHYKYLEELLPNLSLEEIKEIYKKERTYFSSFLFRIKFFVNKVFLLYIRILEKPSKVICFLGPDGSGKTTLIEGLIRNNPYVNFKYYHLKPKELSNEQNNVDNNPHQKDNYSYILSVLKLVYFVFEYNINWAINILPKKVTPVLIVFDRYYDDILADPKRYRYGASFSIISFVRMFIPKPNITFILEAPVDVIQKRKREVSKKSLISQLERYRKLGDKKNHYIIDVNRPVTNIVKEIIEIILKTNISGN